MVARKKLLRLDDMEPIAREATRKALESYSPPSAEDRKLWALGKIITDKSGIFEIYIPNDRPIDAAVISRATVDRETGEVRVEVFLDGDGRKSPHRL